MAIPHAQPGQVIDVHPYGERLREARSHALIKTHALELIRIVLPAGQEFPPHSVYGEVTLLCIEGRVHVKAEVGQHELGPGQVVLLPAQDMHAVHALEDASLLLTVQTPPGLPGSGSSTA